MFHIFNKNKNLIRPKQLSEEEKNKFNQKQLNTQIELGKQSGIDIKVYSDLKNISLMEYTRKSLEIGAAPSAVRKIIEAYQKKEICEEEFEDLCEKSIYVIDLTFIKDEYKITEKPIEKKKTYSYPSAFYGACFGDIAGSDWEYCFSKKERTGITIHNCISKTSHTTDDTILSCATAKAMKEKITLFEYPLTIDEYEERSEYPFKINPYAKNYKEYAKMPFKGAGYGSGFMSWVSTDDYLPYGSFGNGSAMRISPIPEYFDDLDNVIYHSVVSAAATHNHPEGIKGAVVTAVSIWMAKNGYSREQIFHYIVSYYKPEHNQLFIRNENLIKEFTMEEIKKMRGPATCPFSVPAAAICFHESNSFEDVIDNCLSFDGDTDTIGAIAGSIAGAYYGVPEKYRKIVDERKPDKIFDIALAIINKK